MNGRRAVFLDRDGVIIEEVGYLHDPAQVRLLPGVGEAIARLNAEGVATIVVTNQAGVARGLFGESIIARVHEQLDELLAARGARIDRYYHCPHHPQGSVAQYAIECQCRKPRPGMLHQASVEMQLDVPRSWLVGDKVSDLEAAAAAGCEPLLVTTGYGAETAAKIERSSLAKTCTFASLVEAIDFCLLAK